MTTFNVRSHEIRVWTQGGRWYASVDGTQLGLWFVAQAEAWAAGVREAERLDVVAA